MGYPENDQRMRNKHGGFVPSVLKEQKPKESDPDYAYWYGMVVAFAQYMYVRNFEFNVLRYCQRCGLSDADGKALAWALEQGLTDEERNKREKQRRWAAGFGGHRYRYTK